MKSMFDKFKNGDFVDNVERAMVENDFEPELKDVIEELLEV